MFNLLQEWAKHSTEAALFYLISFCAIPLAFGVLLDPRIIRAGFLLIGVFGTISGIFLLLQAPFLAMAQIMIYAVGITLVVVIALMLTNPKLEQDNAPTVETSRLWGVLGAIGVFMVIYMALRAEIWQVKTTMAPVNDVSQIGQLLLTYYSLPFEFASVLLLVALIGAVMLAKAEKVKSAKLEEWEEGLEEEKKEYVAQV
jgi:NADH:ubiquinone oxidoreductase subunit 6 (subunit J)